MATIIRTDGSLEHVQPEHGSKFTLKEVQDAVGGYVAPIQLEGNITLWVDEDGFRKALPKNVRATTIYEKTYGSAGPNGGVVVGTAFFCKNVEC